MDDLFQDDNNTKSVDYAEMLHKFIYRAKIVLRRHWWIIPAALALGIGYKAVEAVFKEPVYVSSAQMILSGHIALPENDVYAEERDNFFGTQIELMGSDQVRARAVERVKLTHPELHAQLAATDAFMQYGIGSLALYAYVKEDTTIFVLQAYTSDREYTPVYLDAVMDEYINRRSEMRSKTSEKTYDAIVMQIQALEQEIEAGEDAIVNFQKKNNIVFIQEQGSAAGTYLADLKRRLAELKTEGRALASIADSRQVDSLLRGDVAQAAADGAQGTLVSAVGSADDNAKYLFAKEQLDLRKADLEEFQIYLKPKHPKIINLKDQIERTTNQLNILRRQAFERIGERKLVVESLVRNLNQEIEIWEKTALENGQLIAEFERLQSRLERSKSAFVRNQESLRAIDTDQNLRQETISVLEDARPARVDGKGTVTGLIHGALLGVILAGGTLFLVSALDNRILCASELSVQFQEPLLGAIPYEPSNDGDAESVLLRKNDDRYVFAEACRNLRTSVFFMGNEDFKPSVFAVTSAIPSEGKSTVSANLAVALSFSHSKVLLVDADLRRGRLHKLFNLNVRKGLTGILEGELSLDDAVQQTEYPHLDFISIGGHPNSPAELLMGKQMLEFIASAREKYDFIVFDTAPILATDDTTSFAGQMDAVLFTIRCAHTQIRQIRPAMARLRERNIDVAGLILNYVDTSQPGYYYYRYSEYYTDPKQNAERNEAAADSA
ncbi:polysaccharide biosynthesis tyrosine autokinase [Coraliomargarita sp. W4R53]